MMHKYVEKYEFSPSVFGNLKNEQSITDGVVVEYYPKNFCPAPQFFPHQNKLKTRKKNKEKNNTKSTSVPIKFLDVDIF